MHRVFVEGNDYLTVKMFTLEDGWWISPNLEDADFVVFTGGADVPPELYGEENVASSCRPEREELESRIFEACVRTGKKMIGICRGGQFLNVMNGGKMWQHVNNHGISGTHSVMDVETREVYECTSTHHQMMRKAEHGTLVAHGFHRATLFVNEDGTHGQKDVNNASDTEVVWYGDTKSLCFQPHPEYGFDSCREFFFKLIERKFG